MQGTPADLVRSSVSFDQLGLDFNSPRKTISRTSSMRSASGDSVCNVERESEDGNNRKNEGMPLEASSKGAVKGSVTLNYFRARENWPILLILLFSFLFVQFLASATDFWVSVWYAFYGQKIYVLSRYHKNDEILDKILINTENYRTKQEETRTFHKNPNRTTLSTNLNNRTIHHQENRSSSFTLSTSMCMAVQGTFVAAIFAFGIARYIVYRFYDSC